MSVKYSQRIPLPAIYVDGQLRLAQSLDTPWLKLFITMDCHSTNRFVRQGSNELDSSSSTERNSPVMLSAAKHLLASHDRPFASLRVTRCDGSNCPGLFFTSEPCLKVHSPGGVRLPWHQRPLSVYDTSLPLWFFPRLDATENIPLCPQPLAKRLHSSGPMRPRQVYTGYYFPTK